MLSRINWPQAAVIVAGIAAGVTLAVTHTQLPGWLVGPLALVFGPMGLVKGEADAK